MKINLQPKELVIIKKILGDIDNVLVFGSRIKGTSRPFSDIDLCLKEPISTIALELLREAFENSDLPFKVDLVEYHKVNNDFRQIIDRQGIPLNAIFL